MISLQENPREFHIETDALRATVRKRDYITGILGGTFVDKATGTTDSCYALAMFDFLMAPGWREDYYLKEPAYHGNLPKHIVEGPQICTQVPQIPQEVIRGRAHLAVRMSFTFTEAGQGYRAGSRWEQTLLFLPGKRYVLVGEAITSANDVDCLFYRLDMPGHIKHDRADTFRQVYLSYHGTIPASEFLADFPPDGRFLYRRDESAIPDRFIRAYQLPAGPWLAGMTLDPAAPCEAWCHQRGYVCFIQENHGRAVKRGERFGAAYVVGYFDSIEQMNEVYDLYKGTRHLRVDESGYLPLQTIPQD